MADAAAVALFCCWKWLRSRTYCAYAITGASKIHRFGIGKYAAATGKTAKQQKAGMWYDGMLGGGIKSVDAGPEV